VIYQDLDQLAGEVLPERIALSTAAPPVFGGMEPPVVTTDDGTTVAYACQYTQHGGSPGLLQWVGLAPAPGHPLTCVPAAIKTP
jgi:hypothetical protein